MKPNSKNHFGSQCFAKNIKKEKRYWKEQNNFKLLNFYSNTPKFIKKNLFLSEIKKTNCRTTDVMDRKLELDLIYRMFMLNDYPNWQLKKWETNYRQFNVMLDNTIRNKKVYFAILYRKEFFKKFNIGIAPKMKFQVKKITFIGRQTQLPIDKHNVVYKIEFTCQDMHYYIGETK